MTMTMTMTMKNQMKMMILILILILILTLMTIVIDELRHRNNPPQRLLDPHPHPDLASHFHSHSHSHSHSHCDSPLACVQWLLELIFVLYLLLIFRPPILAVERVVLLGLGFVL